MGAPRVGDPSVPQMYLLLFRGTWRNVWENWGPFASLTLMLFWSLAKILIQTWVNWEGYCKKRHDRRSATWALSFLTRDTALTQRKWRRYSLSRRRHRVLSEIRKLMGFLGYYRSYITDFCRKDLQAALWEVWVLGTKMGTEHFHDYLWII